MLRERTGGCRIKRANTYTHLNCSFMREPQWHLKALTALGVALLCCLSEWMLGGQGYRTIQAFGGEFGFARIKSFTFLVWQGDKFRFPFDGLVFLFGVTSVGIAVWVTRRHFRFRKSDEKPEALL